MIGANNKLTRHPERSEVLGAKRLKPLLAEGSTMEFYVTFLSKRNVFKVFKSYLSKESHKKPLIDSCACYTRLVSVAS